MLATPKAALLPITQALPSLACCFVGNMTWSGHSCTPLNNVPLQDMGTRTSMTDVPQGVQPKLSRHAWFQRLFHISILTSIFIRQPLTRSSSTMISSNEGNTLYLCASPQHVSNRPGNSHKHNCCFTGRLTKDIKACLVFASSASTTAVASLSTELGPITSLLNFQNPEEGFSRFTLKSRNSPESPKPSCSTLQDCPSCSSHCRSVRY